MQDYILENWLYLCKQRRRISKSLICSLLYLNVPLVLFEFTALNPTIFKFILYTYSVKLFWWTMVALLLTAISQLHRGFQISHFLNAKCENALAFALIVATFVIFKSKSDCIVSITLSNYLWTESSVNARDTSFYFSFLQ